MDRNIRLAYILAYLKNSWFWLGTWVFFYLQFTNYAGIGLIETTMIITMTMFEIPTGAIADLLGKKYTLYASFLIMSFGNCVMALAGNFSVLLISVFIQSVGATLFSGTLDALVYDSLKVQHREPLFDRVISRISSLQLVAIVVAGTLSGFFFSLNPSYPYFAVAFVYFIGAILCLFLTEPPIDSVKFSLKNYLLQTRQGFKILFSPQIKPQIFLLITIAGILTIADEMGETVFSVNLGYDPSTIGSFFAVIFLIASLASQLTPLISKKFKPLSIVYLLGLIAGITFLVSPWVGIVVGTATLIIRQITATLIGNSNSLVINQLTESKYRATTISTFNMVKNLPYVVSAVFIGRLFDLYSAKVVYGFLGLILLVLMILQSGGNKK